MATYIIDNQPAPIDFECAGLINRTLQNAKNLLMTHMGEVPYDRLRGFDPALYGMPVAQLKDGLMEEITRMMLWEPDVKVMAADCELNGAHEAVIRVTVEINIREDG